MCDTTIGGKLSNPARPRIQVIGKDGSHFRYFACSGSDISPGETGWVLMLTNTVPEVSPQAITVADVLGDLHSMQMDEAGIELLRLITLEMIEALEQGRVAPPMRPGEMSAEARLVRLREELVEAFGEPADHDATVGHEPERFMDRWRPRRRRRRDR